MKPAKPHYTSFKFTTAIALAWLYSISAHSAIIFQDDFARSNSNDPGLHWLTHERDDNDIAIYNERLRLRDYLTLGMTHAQFYLDTSGFENAFLSLEWQVLSSTETSDSLTITSDFFEHSQGSSLFTTGLGSPGIFEKTISITDNFVGWIGFWLDVNSASETIYLDNILGTGDLKPYQGETKAAAVSEASSFALIAIGLAGLAVARRKTLRG